MSTPTIVVTGPLTNVARYLATHGSSGLDRIVLMGGAIAEGNFIRPPSSTSGAIPKPPRPCSGAGST